MKNDDLVRSLAMELTPVRRLRGAGQRAALWAGGALVWVGVLTAALGMRGDLAGKLHQCSFLLEGASLLLLFVSSGRSAFRLAVPGRAGQQLLPALAGLTWGLLVASRLGGAHGSLPGTSFVVGGLPCIVRMFVLALGPGITAFVLARRAAPLRPGQAGLWTITSASALGILGTQLLCPRDGALHVLVWHVGPVMLAAVIGIVFGRRLLVPHDVARAT